MAGGEVTVKVVADTAAALAAIAEVQAKVAELAASLEALAAKGITIPISVRNEEKPQVFGDLMDAFFGTIKAKPKDES